MESREIPVNYLFSTVTFLRNQRRALEHADVLLHRGKAHLVVVGQRGDRKAATDDALENVSSRRVGKGPKHEVHFTFRELMYNHMVVQYRSGSQGASLNQKSVRTPFQRRSAVI